MNLLDLITDLLLATFEKLDRFSFHPEAGIADLGLLPPHLARALRLEHEGPVRFRPSLTDSTSEKAPRRGIRPEIDAGVRARHRDPYHGLPRRPAQGESKACD